MQNRDSLKEKELSTVELAWGRDESIDLLEGTQSARFVLVKVNGSRSILTASESNDPWVSVEFSRDLRYVVVRPNSLEEAMNQ